MRNAFGSVPHPSLSELVESLPIPGTFRHILHDIYKDNIMDFIVGEKIVKVIPTSGVKQGDPLSTTAYNLASEPLIRAAKSGENISVTLFFLDNSKQPYTLMTLQSSPLRWKSCREFLTVFHPRLLIWASNSIQGNVLVLFLVNGKPQEANLTVDGNPIHCLRPEEQEIYLGTPIGAKLRFQAPK